MTQISYRFFLGTNWSPSSHQKASCRPAVPQSVKYYCWRQFAIFTQWPMVPRISVFLSLVCLSVSLALQLYLSLSLYSSLFIKPSLSSSPVHWMMTVLWAAGLANGARSLHLRVSNPRYATVESCRAKNFQNKLTKLRRHASRVHFAKILFR